MSSPVFNEKFRRPTIAFTEGLMKAAGGVYREREEYIKWMFRAVVVAVDVEGGKLETPDGEPAGGVKLKQRVYDKTGSQVDEYEITPTQGPKNPKHSVRARIVSENRDEFIDDSNLRTYWALFPGLNNPSPGELVYVVFEDEEMTHGLWIAKVPTNDDEDNANQVLYSEVLTEKGSNKADLFTPQQQTEKPSASPVSQDGKLSGLHGGR